MKQCRACGTRNRDKYQDCVRCGAPLARLTREGKERSGLPPAVKLALAMTGVLVVLVVGFRWVARGTSPSTSGASESNTADTLTDIDAFSAEEPDSPSSTAGNSEAINQASEATRNGKAAFRAGDFQAAMEFFQELIEIAPSNHTGYLYLGLCQQKVGDLEGAKVSLRQAIGLKPNEELTRKALIQLLLDSEEFQEAGELQAWFVENNRFDAEPLLDLGRIHRRQGQFDLAIEELQRAVELAPNSPESSLELGTALSEASRTEEALAVFQKVAVSDPRDPRPHAGLGAALLRGQRYQEALVPLEKAASLDPNGPMVRLNLAITYENLDRIEDSLREYEAFVKLAPNDPSAPRVAELVERAKAALAERKGN